jgi:hypothetical protein
LRFNIAFAQSSFRHFLSRPITVIGSTSSSEAHFNETITAHIFKLGEGNFSMIHCLCADCNLNEEHGGVIWTVSARVVLDYCVFRNNSALFAGSIEVQDAPYISLNFTLITNSRAERFGAGQVDGHEQSDFACINSCNFTHDWAVKWIGGIRMQHNGGPVMYCSFVHCLAETYGALWDYCHKPAFRVVENVLFINNTAKTIGAGVTAFHLLYRGEIRDCQFFGNRNVETAEGYSVYLQADIASLNLVRCVFQGKRSEELAVYFPTSNLTVDDTNQFETMPPR